MIILKILKDSLVQITEKALPFIVSDWLNIQQPPIISDDILKVSLCLIETFYYIYDPSGFILTYKLAGQIKSLSLSYISPSFPKEGSLGHDIMSINIHRSYQDKNIPQKKDFEYLISIWPFLLEYRLYYRIRSNLNGKNQGLFPA